MVQAWVRFNLYSILIKQIQLFSEPGDVQTNILRQADLNQNANNVSRLISSLNLTIWTAPPVSI